MLALLSQGWRWRDKNRDWVISNYLCGRERPFDFLVYFESWSSVQRHMLERESKGSGEQKSYPRLERIEAMRQEEPPWGSNKGLCSCLRRTCCLQWAPPHSTRVQFYALEGHLGLRAEAGAQQEGPSIQVHEVGTSLRGLWSKGTAIELTSLKVCASSFLQHRPLLFLIV